jgi:hypothetical protein
VLGLCEHAQVLGEKIAEDAEVPEAARDIAYVGMTHVGWFVPPAELNLTKLWAKRPNLNPWYQRFGALPSKWRLDLAEPTVLVREQQKDPGERAKFLRRLVGKMRVAVRRVDSDQYGTLLENRPPVWYPKTVVPTIQALLSEGSVDRKQSAELIMGLANGRRLPELELDAQVEGWTVVDQNGVHPEQPPSDSPYLQDIIDFGHTRSLAFAAIQDPRPDMIGQFAQSDPFTRAATSHPDLPALLRGDHWESGG